MVEPDRLGAATYLPTSGSIGVFVPCSAIREPMPEEPPFFVRFTFANKTAAPPPREA